LVFPIQFSPLTRLTCFFLSSCFPVFLFSFLPPSRSGTKAYVQTTKDEFFAFDRTVSRLIEMQSVEYNLKAQVVGAAEDDVETMMEFLEGGSDDDSIEKLWMRYDRDGNGKLDVSEMKALIGDLSFVRRGHRNVPEEEEKEAMVKMQEGAKKTAAGSIEFSDFQRFVKTTAVKQMMARENSFR